MNKWVKLGGAVLLLAWAPFLYAELTSSPQEKRDRLLPEEQEETAPTELQEPEEGTTLGRGGAGSEQEEAELEAEEGDDEHADPAPAQGAAELPVPAHEDDPSADPGVEPAADEILAEEGAEGEEGTKQEDAPPPPSGGPVAQLKQAFDSEPRDALWARDTEAQLAGITSGGDMPDSFLEKAACRTAVCRLDLHWSQENAAPYLDAYEELKQAFGDSIGVDPQGAPTEDGLAVHVYVVRKGYTLADLSK